MTALMSFRHIIDKLKEALSIRRVRERLRNASTLMPARTDSESDYNFPQARYAGEGEGGYYY